LRFKIIYKAVRDGSATMADGDIIPQMKGTITHGFRQVLRFRRV